MQVMKLREVCSKVRKSKSGLYLSMKKGDFPKPIQLGEKSDS
jgi:predicted DNA-binding transcriptional regulator AlpA